jgi:CheY-like chemotaxis protein
VGTEFIVELPKSRVTIETPGRTSLERTAAGKNVITDFPLDKLLKLKGKRILIVDDSKELRYHLQRDLSGTFEIFEAENGNEGLKKALEVQPTVIITDMVMPVMDGERFCKELKALPATSHIPVILLTNQTYDEGQAIGYGAGADVYLTKPVSKELLFQVTYNFIQAQERIHQHLLSSNGSFPEDISINKVDEEFLTQVVAIVEKNLSDPQLDYKVLCEETALSRTVLYSKIKTLTGQGVHEFIRSIRLKKSLLFLREKKLSISQVAFEVGFNSHSYFNKCFIKQYKIAPKDYWKNPSKLAEADAAMG